jgi:hypothetical protein
MIDTILENQKPSMIRSVTQSLPESRHQHYWNEPPPND